MTESPENGKTRVYSLSNYRRAAARVIVALALFGAIAFLLQEDPRTVSANAAGEISGLNGDRIGQCQGGGNLSLLKTAQFKLEYGIFSRLTLATVVPPAPPHRATRAAYFQGMGPVQRDWTCTGGPGCHPDPLQCSEGWIVGYDCCATCCNEGGCSSVTCCQED